MGADSSAKNAATVLRLVGTYNSKSGTLVEPIWKDPEEHIWSFDDLATEILPLSREEARERKAKHRAERARSKAAKGVQRPPKSGKGFTLASLNRGRLRDLYLLMRLRGQTKLPAGKRDAWMFVAAISMSGLVKPQVLEQKLIAMGREKAGWSEAETRSRMHSVLERAHSATAGDKVEWAGQARDVRYWLKNKTIIENLGITPEEEKEMKVIVSRETKQQRNRAQKEQGRRSRGVRPRDEYIANAREGRQHHRRRAKELNSRGLSLRKIGQELGISHTQVKRPLDVCCQDHAHNSLM